MVGTFICIVATIAAEQGTEGDIRKELAEYYKLSKMPASWTMSMEQLASKDSEKRRGGVKRLVALLEQAHLDEKSGKAPWLATPFWGRGPENPARNLRGSIVDALEKAEPESEALPIVRWLMGNEPQVRLQESVAGFLGKIDAKEADDYRRTLVLLPHPNAIVMGMVLAQMAERKAPLPADRLSALCQHHRKVIRDSARKLNQTLKGGDPGPFDPVRALKSAAVRKTLDDLQTLMIDLPGKAAEFVEVTTTYQEKGNDKERVADVMDQINRPRKSQGWLLKRANDSVLLFSPYGTHEEHRDREKTTIRVGKRIDNGYSSWEVNVVSSIGVAKHDIGAYVKSIVATRAKGNENFELSPRGGLTGQFEGQGASLVEAILIAWLDRLDDHDKVAALLLPALDTVYEDRHLVEMARHRLGQILGNRMLVAFVGDRDYAETLKLAQALSKTYPDTQFHEYAKGLAEQLPRRMDDFKDFRLPTAAKWTELKKKMSRREQIDFLCQRLRLLNCFQMGQPGGYSPGSTQYAEPCGISENAAWGLSRGKTEVINPYSELTGQRGIFIRDEDKDRGLDLKIADIPVLVPHLRDNWYFPTVSFWRDFSSDRNLGTTRPYIAGFINDLAQHDLCDLVAFEKMSPKEQEAHLKRIIDWAEANKNKTEEEILATAVQRAVKNKARWHEISGRIEQLVKLKSPRALGVIEQYLEKPEDDGYYMPEMMTQLNTLNSKKAMVWAAKFLDHKNRRLRMQCAMMLFDAGNTDKTVPVLAELLKTGSSYELFGEGERAIAGLLKLGSEPARQAAFGMLDNKHLRGPRSGFPGDSISRGKILPLLEKAGRPDGYRVYLELLDNKGNEFGNASYGTPVAKLAVNEILHDFDDPALKKIREISDFEAQRIAVRRWVEAKIAGTKLK